MNLITLPRYADHTEGEGFDPFGATSVGVRFLSRLEDREHRWHDAGSGRCSRQRETFGVPGSGQGQTGYPQIRCVGLLENGTHALFGVALQRFGSELGAPCATEPQTGHVCLTDRGFSG